LSRDSLAGRPPTRRRFLLLTAAGAAAASGAAGVFAWVSRRYQGATAKAEQLHRRVIRAIYAEQPLAQAIARHYDYLELEPGAAERFARDHEAWREGGGRPEPIDQVFIRFLLSTDFFLHSGAVARPVRYLHFYDPYLAPCANPFQPGRAV
jgi:hypothetical protein